MHSPIARLAIEKDAEKHTDTKVKTGYTSTFCRIWEILKNEYYRTYLVNQRVFKGLGKDKLPKEYGQNKGGT